MAKYLSETVTRVHHWNESLFSFRTTRTSGLRFENGHFVMIGLEVNGKPLMRAYSIASPNYEEELEFFSIKVEDGPLTSRLQHLKVGDPILVSDKPVGTLIIHDLKPGKNLYLFGTGTGLAPFMSIIRDPATYEAFEKVVLIHGVRLVSELAYQDYLTKDLPNDEFLGEMVREKLIYYPTVTREPFKYRGRISHLIENGTLANDVGLPPMSRENDRFMLCGSVQMLADIRALLEGMGLTEGSTTTPGEFVVEKAFVE